MQDAAHMFVLHSEATKPTIMVDAPESPDPADSTSSLTDEQLMVAFARGSSDAFSALFQRYKQPLFGFFRRRLTDPSQAEELTQETFLAVLRASSRYEASALFRTYLYAIGFKILGAHRRKTTFRAMFHADSPPGHEPSIENTIHSEVLLRESVSKLDNIDREILMLREFEQLSYAEISELCSLPLNTVRSRLFRARMALHDLLTAPAPKTHTTDLAESEGRI
jgi:RNA polymerase sigma-70 factor (ECF subfamily)